MNLKFTLFTFILSSFFATAFAGSNGDIESKYARQANGYMLLSFEDYKEKFNYAEQVTELPLSNGKSLKVNKFIKRPDLNNLTVARAQKETKAYRLEGTDWLLVVYSQDRVNRKGGNNVAK